MSSTQENKDTDDRNDVPTASVSRQNKTTFTRIIKRRANPIIVNNIDVSIPFFSVYLIFDEL